MCLTSKYIFSIQPNRYHSNKTCILLSPFQLTRLQAEQVLGIIVRPVNDLSLKLLNPRIACQQCILYEDGSLQLLLSPMLQSCYLVSYACSVKQPSSGIQIS